MTLGKFLRTGAAALGALAVASVTQANAADMYAGGYKEAPVYIPPPFWTGFYVGGHIGAAWETLSFQRHEYDDFQPCNWCSGGSWGYAPGYFDGNHNSGADAFGGVQFGYNFQSPSAFVYGIEVDLGGMSLSTNRHDTANTTWAHYNAAGTLDYVGGSSASLDGQSQGGFYGDITGRLGWTWGPALIYAKGGFAWLNADLKMRESVFDSSGQMCNGNVSCAYNHDNNNTLTGWTVGGGVEWKVSPAWSIKVEYLHFDFTNFNNNCCNDTMYQVALANGVNYNNFNNHADLQVDTVKLGFNYFWNPPPAPLK